MNKRPIGVFDSGLGGLSAMRKLTEILPFEDIVYFGDSQRTPYGSRGRDVIVSYTRQDIAFLIAKGVKIVLAACGTASSNFLQHDTKSLPVGYIGVVEPCAAAAAAITSGHVGIIGTESTIASDSFQKAVKAISPNVKITAAACPLFVPLVESGHYAKDDTMVALACEEYLQPLKDAQVDTVILGCTHYPLLTDAIMAYLGSDVKLVDSGKQAALALKKRLCDDNMLNEGANLGTHSYYVSDAPERFARIGGKLFPPVQNATIHRINIEEYAL